MDSWQNFDDFPFFTFKIRHLGQKLALFTFSFKNRHVSNELNIHLTTVVKT